MKFKLLFAFTALLFSGIGAPKLLASQCTGNANNCTPVQLCDGATEKANGKVRWTTAPSLKRYVESAKELSMDCGVIEPIITCKSNPEICTISQLCKEATYQIEGRTVWKRGAVYRKHVQLAESFGLQCDIKETNIFVVTTDTVWLRIEDKNNKIIFEKTTKKREEIFLPQDSSPYRMRGGMAGSVYLKIDNQIYGPVGKGTNHFNNFLISPEFIERNLEKTALNATTTSSAANGPAQSGVIKDYCLEDPTNCSDHRLCSLATYKDSKTGQRKWGKGYKAKYVKASKARGLFCGVKNAEPTLTIEKPKAEPKISTSKPEIKRPRARPEDVHQKTEKCYDNERSCDDDLLCVQATIQIDGRPIIWEEKAAFLRFVKEAKIRGLRCDVETECNSRNWSECSNIELCNNIFRGHEKKKYELLFKRGFYCKGPKNNRTAAQLSDLDDPTFCKIFTSAGSMSGTESWSPKEAEIEGKRRGITCGVLNRVFSQTQNVLSTTALIQRELNRVGCNVGAADGVIGPETRKGLFAFTTRTDFLYNPKLLQEKTFLIALKKFPENTCPKIASTISTQIEKKNTEIPKTNSQTSYELEELRRERKRLEKLIEQQNNQRLIQQGLEMMRTGRLPTGGNRNSKSKQNGLIKRKTFLVGQYQQGLNRYCVYDDGSVTNVRGGFCKTSN